jgi:hypothetical protein
MAMPSMHTISETRLLPAAIGLFAFVIGLLSLSSDAPMLIKTMGAGMLAVALGSLWLFMRPRWVLRLVDGKLLYRDLSSRSVREFELATVISASLRQRVSLGTGGDGGVGFQNELLLETPQETIVLPLPSLKMPPAKVLQTVRDHLPKP